MKRILNAFAMLGINLYVIKDNFKGLRFYIKDFVNFKKLYKNSDFGPINIYPILIDKFDKAGSMSGHYFHQDLLVAQKIFENNPQTHVDIGSRIDGFVAHVATFRKIEIIDIRKQESKIENINFKQIDFMSKIPKEFENYTDSISSLHTIEHFGLGRYGDVIDTNGHIKGLNNIKNMLKTNGKFYFSVPIGNQRIEFNAHRVFSLKYLFDLLNTDYELLTFSYVDDKGDIHINIELSDSDVKNSLGCRFGCGIFELIKK